MSTRILVVEHVGLEAALLRLLPAEREHVLGLRAESAARRYANGRIALRHWLAGPMGVRASEVRLSTMPSGVPRVVDCDWSLSISHADSVSVIALSIKGPVGVDIETMRPIDDLHHIAAQNFHRSERLWLRCEDGQDLSRRFLRLWVRKEAVVKAAGLGLYMGLNTWSALEPAPADGPSFSILDASRQPWWIRDVDIERDHLIALATVSKVEALTVERRNCQWLLGATGAPC